MPVCWNAWKDWCLPGCGGALLVPQHLGSWSLRPAMSLRSRGEQRVWHWPWTCWSRVGLGTCQTVAVKVGRARLLLSLLLFRSQASHFRIFNVQIPSWTNYCLVNISIKGDFLNGWKVALMYLSVRALIFILQPFSVDVFFNPVYHCDAICSGAVSQCPSPLRVITPPIRSDHILNRLKQVSKRQSTLCPFYHHKLLQIYCKKQIYLMGLDYNHFRMAQRQWVFCPTGLSCNSQMLGMHRVWNGTDMRPFSVRFFLWNNLWVAYSSFINVK